MLRPRTEITYISTLLQLKRKSSTRSVFLPREVIVFQLLNTTKFLQVKGQSHHIHRMLIIYLLQLYNIHNSFNVYQDWILRLVLDEHLVETYHRLWNTDGVLFNVQINVYKTTVLTMHMYTGQNP